MIVIGRSTNVERALREQVDKFLKEVFGEWSQRLQGMRTYQQLHQGMAKLKEEVEDLKITKLRREEEFARREREITHKIGLEKKRQEQELELAKREAKVEVDEDNLVRERGAFADQMTFEREHLEKTIERIDGILKQVLKRLPSAEIIAEISNKK